MSVNREQIISALNGRYACKKFDPSKVVSENDWATLEEALRLSPSSFGLQLWKFIVVTNQDLKEKLKPLSWDQPQITTCSHLVVITTRTDVTESDVQAHIDNIAKDRDVTAESLKGYQDYMTGFVTNPEFKPMIPFWTAKQGYIALGFLLETAALLNIDSCPMEGFDSKGYDQVLGLVGSGYSSAVICPVGYRASDEQNQHAKKSRFPKSKVFDYR